VRYRIELTRDALKGIGKAHPRIRPRIRAAIDALADAPTGGSSQLLHGSLEGARRVRVGTYRIVYVPEEATRTVYVLDVGPRGRIYRRANR